MHLRLPLLALLATLLVTACSNVSEAIASGLRLEVVRVAAAADGTVRVTWRIRNPNVSTYLIDRATHKLALDGATVGTFASVDRLAIPRGDQVEQTDVLKPANAGVAARVRQLAAAGSASYRLDSTVLFLILDDNTEKSSLTGSGTTPVVVE